jgi:hypothetical protein
VYVSDFFLGRLKICKQHHRNGKYAFSLEHGAVANNYTYIYSIVKLSKVESVVDLKLFVPNPVVQKIPDPLFFRHLTVYKDQRVCSNRAVFHDCNIFGVHDAHDVLDDYSVHDVLTTVIFVMSLKADVCVVRDALDLCDNRGTPLFTK